MIESKVLPHGLRSAPASIAFGVIVQIFSGNACSVFHVIVLSSNNRSLPWYYIHAISCD